MREISFRGFHSDKDGGTAIFIGGKRTKGEWCYGKLLEDHVSDICAIASYVNLAGNIYDLSEITIVNVIPETVGQYIGLTDKNGVRIFEGDILSAHFDDKHPEDETKAAVVHKGYAFGLKEADASHVDFVASESDVFFIKENYCVIGNIYNNPELMKGGEANV